MPLPPGTRRRFTVNRNAASKLSERGPWAIRARIEPGRAGSKRRPCQARGDAVYRRRLSWPPFPSSRHHVALVRIRFPHIGYVIWLAQVVLSRLHLPIACGEAAAAGNW